MPRNTYIRRTDKAGDPDSMATIISGDTLEEVVSIGVGDGTGRLFVKGSSEAIKKVAGFIQDSEDLIKSRPFSNLTPAQAELLACLSEEASEVGQAVGKILRHGYESSHPDFPMTYNREYLEKELGDLLAIQERLVQAGELNVLRIRRHADQKLKNLPNWLHHN